MRKAILILSVAILMAGCKKEGDTINQVNPVLVTHFTVSSIDWVQHGTDGMPGSYKQYVANVSDITDLVVSNGLVKVDGGGLALPYIDGSGTITYYAYEVGKVVITQINYTTWSTPVLGSMEFKVVVVGPGF